MCFTIHPCRYRYISFIDRETLILDSVHINLTELKQTLMYQRLESCMYRLFEARAPLTESLSTCGDSLNPHWLRAKAIVHNTCSTGVSGLHIHCIRLETH